MKDKIHQAKYIVSEVYSEIVHSSMKQTDILPYSPEVGKTKLLDYVREKAKEVTEFDAIIIDLTALEDTDAEILEALETIRYWEDDVRIIILGSGRCQGDSLLSAIFLMGIYNITCSSDFVEIRDFLSRALGKGMSYKDAMGFRDVVKSAKLKEQMPQEVYKVSIALYGAQKRSGVTHNTMSLAVTLRRMGYLVAVVERKKNGTDFLSIMESYQEELKEDGYFCLEDVDIYPYQEERNMEDIHKKAYNFIVMDMGEYTDTEEKTLKEADETIIVCGSKEWELRELGKNVLSHPLPDRVSYLFNFTDASMQKEIQKMMEPYGTVFLSVYNTDLFSPVFPEEYVAPYRKEKEEKKRFRLFGRKKNRKGK